MAPAAADTRRPIRCTAPLGEAPRLPDKGTEPALAADAREKENDPKRTLRLERWLEDGLYVTPVKKPARPSGPPSTPSTTATAPSTGPSADRSGLLRSGAAVSPVTLRYPEGRPRETTPVQALYASHDARLRTLSEREPAPPAAAPASALPASAPPASAPPGLAAPRLRFLPPPRDDAVRERTEVIPPIPVPAVLPGEEPEFDWSCRLAPLRLDDLPRDAGRMHPSLRQSLRFLAQTEIPVPAGLGSGRVPLLPPATTSRPTLVLDLDETLIHCVKSPNVDRLAAESPPDLCIHFSDGQVKGSIRFRPYTKIFLEVVSNLFEVVVFTASTQAYADTVLDALDKERTWITHRLYRSACTLSAAGGYFKDLSLLGRPLARTALVDNSPTSLAMQPDNGIPVSTWRDDQTDREMIELLTVLHAMHQAEDVRDILRAKYGLSEFLTSLRTDPSVPALLDGLMAQTR